MTSNPGPRGPLQKRFAPCGVAALAAAAATLGFPAPGSAAPPGKGAPSSPGLTASSSPALTAPSSPVLTASSSPALTASSAESPAVGVNAAPRAAYATEAELPPEGVAHVVDVAILAGYARAADADRLGGAADIGALAVRTRLDLGRRLTYHAGLDGEIGATSQGVVYGLTGTLVGLGLRLGDAVHLAIGGGVGMDGAAGAIPFAARFPVEVDLAVDLGPVRAQPWARVARVAGAEAREGGVTWWSAADEVEAGLLLRLAPTRRYWSTTRAGGGLALGVTYRELLGTHVVGVALGIDLAGSR